VTLPAANLRRLIAAVLPCAASDGLLPALNAVRLETTGRSLYAVATDRYTMAVARHTGPGLTRPRTAGATIPRAEATAMLRLVPRGHGGPVTVRIRQDRCVTLTTAGITHRTPAADRLYGRFPDWRAALTRLLDGAPVRGGQPVHVNPAYLARFAAASDGDPRGLRARLHRTGYSHPVLIVSAGDWFLGALMSIRPSSAAADPRAAWETDLAPRAAA